MRHGKKGYDVYDLKRSPAPDFLVGICTHLSDEVYVYDQRDLTMKYANPAACDRRGWSSASLGEKRISDISVRLTDALIDKHLQPLRKGEEGVIRVQLYLEGVPVEVTSHLASLPDAGNVFVSILRDLSEQSGPDDDWGAISELSHEMRTPLTSIKGALGLLESSAVCELPPLAQPILEVATRNSDRLLSMVNRILDFSRVSSRKIEKEHDRVDLVKVVSQSVSELQGFGFEHKVDVQVQDVPGHAFVIGDDEQLESVLTNLLSNAIKHSPSGSTVAASVADRGETWRVSVHDEGEGISESVRKKVFESYARGKPGKEGRSSGTGLGLAIAKKIVTLHNGLIDFRHTEGVGTEFYFDIPKLSE